MDTRKGERRRKRGNRREEGDHRLREGQCLSLGEFEVAVVRAGRDGGATND